jgi:hypothetical protein
VSELLARHATTILAASEAELRADVTLGGKLIMDRAGNIKISYAPFEHIQRTAQVVIIPNTPRPQQAANALIAARGQLLAGANHGIALSAAKVFASFSGPMCANLAALLDYIGLARWLGIASTDLLWQAASGAVHFTSALRHPVFVSGANYAGNPAMTRTPVLRQYLEGCLQEEALALPNAVWVPLGPKATEGVAWLVRNGVLDAARVLNGLPHPSGANAERIAYFLRRKPRDALSPKTDATTLDHARERLIGQIAALPPQAR